MKKSSDRLLSTALLMVFVTLSAKALGMLRDILLAANFGTGMEAVAYEAASRLPITLFDFALGGVVTAALIPIFNELLVKEGQDSAFDFANRYFNLILILTALISLVGVVFAKPLISFLAPHIAEDAAALATTLCRIMFPMIVFTGIAFCYVGILQSFAHYMLPAVMSLVSNLVMVGYFFTLCGRFGVYGLSVALVVGWFLQAAIQAPTAHKLGFYFKPANPFFDRNIRRAMKMALPILICSWLQPITNLINTRFASGFLDGRAITMVGYANRLYIMLVGIFSFVATNLLFPKFSRATAQGDGDGANQFAAASVKVLMLLMVPLAVGIFLLAEPLTRLVYMRGEFTAYDARMTASVLRLFVLGIPFMSANEVFTKLFFARQSVKRPMAASLLSIAFNIAAVSLLVHAVGFDGIGLSSAASIALCTLLNYVLLSRGGALFTRRDVGDFIKILLSATVMGVCVYFCDQIFRFSSDILRLLALGGIGAAVYAACVFCFPTAEIKSFLKKKEVKHD